MKFFKEKSRDIYLSDTRLENLFISEYMPMASGDYIKVYIYAMMCAEHGQEISDKLLASQLGISEADIDKAWDFWESVGAVKKHESIGRAREIEFLNLREQFYAAGAAPDRDESRENKDEGAGSAIGEMYEKIESALGRSLSVTDLSEIASWINDVGASPAVIFAAVKYSMERKKDSLRYIGKVVKSWTGEGLITESDVADYLSDTDRRHSRYREVMKMLGLSRNPTAFEMEMMDRWFDDYGFSLEKIREACSKTTGISNPNFNYIDKIVKAWREEAENTGTDVNEHHTVSNAVLNRYYDYLREKAEKEAKARLEEIYRKIPEIKVIDEEISSIGISLSKALVQRQSSTDSRALRERMESLREDRAYILAENDFDINYTDIRYRCSKCSDTGINEMGGRCECMQQRIREAEIWQKENGIKN